MDKSYCSSEPDSVISLMSAEPVDSCTQVTVSSDTEGWLGLVSSTAQSGGSSNLASPERELIQSDTGDGCKGDWKKVSYFNPVTGTSIIKITSEMFKKSRASSAQADHDSSEFIDSSQRCNFETDLRNNVCAGECDTHSGHEDLLSSGMSSSGAGELRKQGCFGGVVSSETAHSVHSLDDGKVKLDNDKFSTDFLYIDEPDYDCEEKVIFMDDKEEETAWEPVVAHRVQEPTGDLRGNESSDVSKHLSFSAVQLPRKESSFQVANEKLRGDLAEACAETENKMETGFNVQAAVDVTESSAESGRQENDYKCNVVADCNKTTNITSMPKSLTAEASDSKSRISPGPLRLTGHAKSTAQPEFSCSSPSLFTAYPSSDVNINNNVCQTSVSSVTSILSLDSRSSNRDEVKGWTRDRGSFSPNLPESSCRNDASDAWAELEDLPSQSFEMRTFGPEKMNVDDLSLSKSDKEAAGGHPEGFSGVTSHYVPSSHAELNHVEVGQVQSEKLKLMQTRKERKQSRLKAGVMDSSEISGNKGDRSVEELLEFINSKETERAKSKKTSQKAKKQQVATPNPSPLNFTIKVTVTDEILYNWQTPDASNAVSNGFLMHDRSKECADAKEADNSVKIIEESTKDSYSVTVLGSTSTSNGFAAQEENRECFETVNKSEASPSSNGFAAQEESRECTETVNKSEASSSSNGFAAQEESRECTETVVNKPDASRSLANVVSTVANGFQESNEVGGTARAEERNRKENSLFQTSLATATIQPSYAVADHTLRDTVTATSSSSVKSTSDSSSEAVATDDNDSNKDFTVVQKKKRNRNVHAEKSQSYRAKTESSLDFGRSRVQNGRRVDDSFKVFPPKYNQQYNRKLASTVDNRHPVHPAWGALLRDRPTKGEVLGKNSSGDSSETSSVCSASVQRESTSFAKVALGNDAISQSKSTNSEASVSFHKGETRTLQSAKNACESQQIARTACGGNVEPVVSPHAVDQCHSSSQDTTVIPTATDDGFTKDHSNFTDTGLGSDLNKVSLPSGNVASFHSSTSYQEMTLPSGAAGEASRAFGRSPVVFDTREKSRFLAPAGDIEISFGFDADDEGTQKAEAELTDSNAVLGASEAQSSSVLSSQTAPESDNCNVVVDINSNHPHFQGSINKSAVIAFPSHGFQPSASHMPLIYSSPHPLSLGVGYVLPMPMTVPIGIVPPFMTCSTRSLSSATVIPHPAFESKGIMAPLPDVSIESASQKQEQQQRGAEICALAPAQLVASPAAQELPSTRSTESSNLEGRDNYFDLAAAQGFHYLSFHAAIAPGSRTVSLTIDD